jgi:CRISPR system Cascade subunit CasB
MTEFIEWLKKCSNEDSKVRAVLRRSLAFEPGQFHPAYKYVESFLTMEESSSWKRKMFYLVAGLWATHEESGHSETKLSIGKACAKLKGSNKGSESTEKRFIAVLDADSGQLPIRLRHLLALLKEYPIDFSELLNDLLYWNNERKSSQNKWARDFYRSQGTEKQIKLESLQETI